MTNKQRVMCDQDILNLLEKYAPISNGVGAILSLIGLALYAEVEDDLARAVLPIGWEVVKTPLADATSKHNEHGGNI